MELSIGNRDLTIFQSPTILSSNRGGGTTGAVVWKITPLIASWVTSPSNFLFKQGILNARSSVLELGCGISGIIGLALAPQIKSYVLTDQSYVLKLLSQNISVNEQAIQPSSRSRKNTSKPKKDSASTSAAKTGSNIVAQALDWETDEVTPSLTNSELDLSFDAVIACDCIYNDALIEPLVQTCIDACKLRAVDASYSTDQPTVCIVAQQLRSSEVFEGWLRSFHKTFKVWRMPDEELIDGLKSDSGFVVHIGVLR